MTIQDIIFSLIFLFLTFNLKNLYPFTAYENRILNWVFFYHTVVCLAATPILFTGGDAGHYWSFPKTLNFEALYKLVAGNPSPSNVMFIINYFPSHILDLSFFPGMLMYSLFGFWGFILIIMTIKSFLSSLEELKDVTLLGVGILPFIFMLPNMHFWSVGIGKDTILFFSISLLLYSFVNIKKRWLGVIIAAILSYYIRPHVLLFIAAGYGMAFIFSSKLNLFQKIAFAGFASLLFFPLLNDVLEFAKIEEVSTEHLESFSTSKATSLAKAGSGIDFSGYPYPLKVLTFAFRPFFFDINGVPAFIASIENLIQLILLIFFFKNKSIEFVFKANIVIRAAFFYFVIGVLAFAPVMSNLGIIIREKNMLMPAFLIFIVGSIKYKLLKSSKV